MLGVRLLAVEYASYPHVVLASLHNQICSEWACIIKYMWGVRLIAVECAIHPHGVLASLHNQIYAGSETACSRSC
jgi:hypothetical protein